MSLFGKLKNIQSGPPLPPRRGGSNAGFQWPKEEIEGEEADTYEPPPCELALKAPQKPVEEIVYLDRSARPEVPQRNPPPPRPGKTLSLQGAEFFNFEASSRNPPAIDRSQRPGRNKMMPTPQVQSPPLVPASRAQEEVYLDPNNEQDDTEELYLEPEAACSPAPRSPQRMPLSSNATVVQAPVPMMKPPVPKAKSSSFLPSTSDVKTATSVEVRLAAPPAKLPPPAPSPKPLMAANLREAMSGSLSPSASGAKSLGWNAGTRGIKPKDKEDREWFAGDCNRKTAEERLMNVNKDGAFLIRHSSAQNPRQPFTLAVLYQQKVFNIPIRFLEETQSFALGKEGKKNEETFTSLDEIISYHRDNKLLLVDSVTRARHAAYLTHTAHT